MNKLSWYYDRYRDRAQESQVCEANTPEVCRASLNKLRGCYSDGNRDILSYLPDPIRSHIVSFLPMKDAIRTKILSRRWKPICSSLSRLKFHYDDFDNLREFRNYVDRTLILHDGSDITKFNSLFKVDDDIITTDHVSAWVTFAIQHKVRHLKLRLPYDSCKLESLPCCFFTCSTLSILHLKGCKNLKWPKVIDFPMLKHLKVKYVTFYDENVTNKLFSSSACPVLEELSIDSCKFDGVHTLSISFPSLKILKLKDLNFVAVNLSIPILTKIVYRCSEPPNVSCETISSIFDACFHCYMMDSIEDQHAFRNSARKILASLSNVCTLSFRSEMIDVLATDPDLLDYLPASYCNLKHFNVDIMSTQRHVEVVACLLKTAPNLQTLCICFEEDSEFSDVLNRQEYWQLNELSIADSLRHLKNVQIWNFKGCASEMEILRRLLGSASTLEEMSISYERDIGNFIQNRMKFSEIMSSFKRVSPHATILFQ
ncbi:hypothetical protein ACHQM5_024753 [Ranunculus cassubicifolius]